MRKNAFGGKHLCLRRLTSVSALFRVEKERRETKNIFAIFRKSLEIND